VSVHTTGAEIRPGRMEPIARLPVFLALAGKRAMLAGGSSAAAWKAELLSAAGAHVDVYAEEISLELRALAGAPPRGAIKLHERAWIASDLKTAAVAVGAFADDADAASFAEAARKAGVPVNVIDKPEFCDFAFGAIVNRSPLVIGISTDGAAPVFAQAIRAKLEMLLPTGFAAWAAAAQHWRSAVRASGLTFAARCAFWRLFAAHAVTHAKSEPTEADIRRLLAAVRRMGATLENGSVTVIDAPADPDLLTVRAVRALQTADVIAFDALVSLDVLDFARREARKLMVDEAGFGAARDESEIDSLTTALAAQGKHVVRLKGSYPAAAVPRGRPVVPSGPSPLQNHRQPVARPDRDQALRLDRMAGLEAQAITLRDRRQDQDAFFHGECGADADARAGAEGQVGEARARRCALR
jgi:uroporphyrin-III C-methyltransferase / precorrin-2 dehydrogenase / sirohydrochlorin ferrochelatase